MKAHSEENILNYSITREAQHSCIELIIKWLHEDEKGKFLVCANPHSLEIAATDSIFSESIKKADLVIPDGIGIIMASIILGGGIRERVTGNDIFLGVSKALNKEKGYSYFFLGSYEDTLDRIKENMSRDFSNIQVVGTYSPPFKDEFSDEDTMQMIEAVNTAGPDVLWVGMTAPKQEKWIYNNKNKLNAKFIGAIGAVFDFYSGKVKRSHPLFQKFGLEWLPRLAREPHRLWRRIFISSPRFLFHVIQNILKQNAK